MILQNVSLFFNFLIFLKEENGPAFLNHFLLIYQSTYFILFLAHINTDEYLE